jgi:hypothetical protein
VSLVYVQNAVYGAHVVCHDGKRAFVACQHLGMKGDAGKCRVYVKRRECKAAKHLNRE